MTLRQSRSIAGPPDVAHDTSKTTERARGGAYPHGMAPLAFRGVELAGEAGEAWNTIKKLERETMGIVGSRSTLDALAEELADMVIAVDLVAMIGVDLEAAIARKFKATSEKLNMRTKLALHSEGRPH
jgi:NTP pyrophosphatase (non-canonical NTP hydrolase)